MKSLPEGGTTNGTSGRKAERQGLETLCSAAARSNLAAMRPVRASNDQLSLGLARFTLNPFDSFTVKSAGTSKSECAGSARVMLVSL